MLFNSNVTKLIIYLFAGCLFGFGLALSGMTDPSVVVGFLDLLGAWNGALLFVMLGAISVTAIGYMFIFKMSAPKYASTFNLPNNQSISKSLILGALLFGIGWGLYGLCPGPALASLASFNPQTFAFVVAMGCGMFLANTLTKFFKP